MNFERLCAIYAPRAEEFKEKVIAYLDFICNELIDKIPDVVAEQFIKSDDVGIFFDCNRSCYNFIFGESIAMVCNSNTEKYNALFELFNSYISKFEEATLEEIVVFLNFDTGKIDMNINLSEDSNCDGECFRDITKNLQSAFKETFITYDCFEMMLSVRGITL